MGKIILSLAGMLAAGMFGAGAAWAGPTFDQVKQKGQLACGVSTGVAGFSLAESDGTWKGLDVDFCRAVAAAVLGDAQKVRFVPLTPQQRFTALQAGEIDLLARNTTWTLLRDAKQGLDFTVVNYYDGQGFLVPAKLKVKSARELKGATVCVQSGSTNELNLTDFSRQHGLNIRPVVIESFQESISAFFGQRCDALTTDRSGLASIRAHNAPNAQDYDLLPEVISKEPLGPVVRRGDEEWRAIVKWTFFAMINAEEKNVTSANVDEMTKSTDPDIQRLLGVQPGFGEALKLDDKWAWRIVKQVGNYGESFKRNLTDRIGVERGLNALHSAGGLQYAPPIR